MSALGAAQTDPVAQAPMGSASSRRTSDLLEKGDRGNNLLQGAEMIQDIQNYAGWIVGVFAALGVLAVIYRWARKRTRLFRDRWSRAYDTIVGREAILHPDTGVVLVPATPGLGSRMATMETALANLSDTKSAMEELTSRVDGIEQRLSRHISESATHHGGSSVVVVNPGTNQVLPPPEPSS